MFGGFVLGCIEDEFASSKYSFTNGRRAEVIQEISLRELGIHRSDSPEKDRFPLGDLHVL